MIELSKLFDCIDYELIQGSLYNEISDIAYDISTVVKDCLYICRKDGEYNGHDFIDAAIKKGAKALLVEENITAPIGLTVIKVSDALFSMAFISAAYFGNPAEKLRVIGVTGTNGKTTTTNMIKTVLNNAGRKCNVISAQSNSYLLHKELRKKFDDACDSVVMEVPAQAIKYDVTAGILFDIGIFMNISKDQSIENGQKDFKQYLKCKSMLFKQCKIGIINVDDEFYEDILEGHTCSVETFGFAEDAVIRAHDNSFVDEEGNKKIIFSVLASSENIYELNLSDDYNIYNALAAIGTCRIFGVKDDIIKEALKNI